MAEPLWTKDPSILFSAGTWQRFVPTKDMDVPTALNAVVRFTLYFAVILFVSTGQRGYLIAIPGVLAATAVFGYVFPTTRKLVETFGNAPGPKAETKPTAENPFMNPLLTEIVDNPTRPDAANIEKASTKREMEKAFQKTSDLYMDTTDRFDLAQSMRSFYTLQSARIPNDQAGFLKHLAKGQDTPDTSSAFPARNAKIHSEGYVPAPGSMRNLPNSTSMPTGTLPSGPAPASA